MAENFVIDRVALKKQAKKILDKKTFFMLLCFALYGGILAICFCLCFFIPNPLERIIQELLYEYSLINDSSLSEWIVFGVFKFFRAILFFALIYPFSVCMSTIPLYMVQEKKITWESAFKPIEKARYFIEYMITGARKFLGVFLWGILLIVPGIAAHHRYSFAKFIFVENNELTSGEAIQKSKEETYGYKGQLFSMDMSFIGWFIFGICTCGVGMLYLICYYSVTKALYYTKICQANQISAEQ